MKEPYIFVGREAELKFLHDKYNEDKVQLARFSELPYGNNKKLLI